MDLVLKSILIALIPSVLGFGVGIVTQLIERKRSSKCATHESSTSSTGRQYNIKKRIAEKMICANYQQISIASRAGKEINSDEIIRQLKMIKRITNDKEVKRRAKNLELSVKKYMMHEERQRARTDEASDSPSVAPKHA